MGKLVVLFAIAFCFSDGNAFKLEGNDLDRISNGIIAVDNQFPYAVSLQQLSLLQATTRGHRCGGAMITFQHVLTTASCTYDLVNGVAVPIVANQYRVFAGASLLTNDANPDRIRSIANFTAHPEHLVAPALLNDIAIITLATPFLNTTVTPIPLPTADFAPVDFSLCTVAGWGATAAGAVNTSVELRYTTKYIYNQILCTNLYSTTIGVSNVFASMVCAASYDILSVGCQGDQGNSLVCNNQLTGVMFFPTSCQATSFPELYTRVSNYTTWIRSVTGGASSFRPEILILGLFTVVQMALMKIIS